MERMEDTLQERMAEVIDFMVRTHLAAGPWGASDARYVADAALAALGLDDLEKAVERGLLALEGARTLFAAEYPDREAALAARRGIVEGILKAAFGVVEPWENEHARELAARLATDAKGSPDG